MEFIQTRKIANYLSKEYAEDLFRLLMTYQDISASEAASRLNMHIQTAQDFLEVFTEYHILSRKEVAESKRPYYRYSLSKKRIIIDIDLVKIFEKDIQKGGSQYMIREKKNSGAKFSVSRNRESFSGITLWIGEGRSVKERKINLTEAQGRFLYNLPFPDATPLSTHEILERSGVDISREPEIMDIVEELIELGVIERVGY